MSDHLFVYVIMGKHGVYWATEEISYEGLHGVVKVHGRRDAPFQ